MACLGWYAAATRGARRGRRRQGLARRGEDEAEHLLERAGYTVEERQATERWTLVVDGQPWEVASRADLIVSRGGRWYVAEVKTGSRAPDPSHAPTRRQLLEYQVVFDADGVLLVDMEQRRVHRVEFPDL